MEVNVIYNENCLDTMSRMEDNSIECVVTSPPYFGQRIYSSNDDIGLEVTPLQYIDSLMKVFGEVYRVLKPEGSVWVNIGDTYNGTKHGNDNPKWKAVNTKDFKKEKWDGCKTKDLIGIPWMFAFAMRDRLGYYLRNDIIWNKPNALPEPVTDRLVKSHEHIFLFTKSSKYYFDCDAIQENACGGGKRSKRDVWSVNTTPSNVSHSAMYPEALITPCVLAGCPENGIVYDMFMGSGTTGIVALKCKRNFIGSELNPEYAKIARQRTMNVMPAMNGLF